MMIIVKKVGIWMNHSIAYVMEFTAGLITTIKVDSKAPELEKILPTSCNNSLALLKEQHIQASYYKRLEESLNGCEEVLLFGPTYAKVKLFDALRTDKRFAKTKIGIIQTKDMTEAAQREFVSNHFSKKRLINSTS